MIPITGGAPKELLPLAGVPVLAYVIVEMLGAGASRVVIVGSPEKPALTEFVESRVDPRVRLMVQPEMRGLADAVAQAGVTGPVVIGNADSVIRGPSPVGELAARVTRGGWDAAIALREVPLEHVRRFGIAEISHEQITRLVEKPTPAEAPSRWAIGGRYALSGETLTRLMAAAQTNSGSGEFGLTEWLAQQIESGLRVAAVPFPEGTERLDCGSPDGYADAQARFTEAPSA